LVQHLRARKFARRHEAGRARPCRESIVLAREVLDAKEGLERVVAGLD
jgi:hypothetical protein